MALLSPIATSLLSAKDHAFMHRVLDVDESAPEGALTIDSSGNAVLAHSVDWSAGNTWYLGLTEDIEAFIASANCASGDTLVLASGTYTITDDIDIAKAINIVGQGIGKTTISCATASKNVFDISASNVRISDLGISSTGYSNYAIKASGNLTGLVFENLDISITAAGALNGIFL